MALASLLHSKVAFIHTTTLSSAPFSSSKPGDARLCSRHGYYILQTHPSRRIGVRFPSAAPFSETGRDHVSCKGAPHVGNTHIYAKFGEPGTHTLSAKGAGDQPSLSKRIVQFQDAFWRFLRPHTIRGTIIGTTAVVARALIDNSYLVDWGLLPKALRGLLALLCGNGYIVGINQIYDIGIDKVNKPFLPVAAGDLSVPAAWGLVVSLALLGIIIVATNFGPLITCLYSLGLFLGAIYSVPPFRLKRFPVAAFLIIATVRGFLLNFGVYYATRASLGLAFTWSPPIMFITFFVTVFATVIAITKDLADIEGDRKFQISTFATKLGVRNISFLGSGLLLLNYIGAIVAAWMFPEVFRRSFMVVGHSLLALALLYQTWVLYSSKYTKEAIAVYYRFIWNLFYAEYAVFPFI
ncbi:hypothetical protein KP509_11G008300 [Ceratopteris richardii]|uniref:Uncharacterized protein n=1 Tax=Ceratopteris richardii TaxID=49495 RepID=A0A8T2TNV8_CERRI|nr:hypothetical protein KP509_11G008300 [Ceratopteris richardii]